MKTGDFQLLSDLEKASERYEWIPSDRLNVLSKMSEQDIEYHLGRLNEFGLVEWRTVKYTGYRLLTDGYDALALHDLVEGEIIEAIGESIGVGKEADIYDVLTPSGKRAAVKFNRLGITFTKVREVRPYEPVHGWIDASKSAAAREFKVLQKLHPKVSVPEAIACNRHVVVMGLVDGEELGKVADIDLPEVVLDLIIENIKSAYDLDVVHADLSEYNILIKSEGEILIIDWPQWVGASHPRADELLERDVTNVLKHFRSKFQIDKNAEEVLEYIRK